jgi:hypothetical protein
MKFVNTKDDSVGGMLHDDGKLSVMNVIDGFKTVEIIEDLEKVKDLIDTSLPIIQEILRALQSFFSSIANPFPPVIKQNDNYYKFTMQKAPWEAIDKIFYMNDENKNDIIYVHEAKTMAAARRELRKELKGLGYIK